LKIVYQSISLNLFYLAKIIMSEAANDEIRIVITLEEFLVLCK